MNKLRLSVLFAFVIILLSHVSVFAASTLPEASVWFTPADATSGTAITVNALVFNNTNEDATVTVAFTTSTETIGTEVTTVTAGSAKTVSHGWLMPKNATVVTAAITSATNSKKQTIASLVGTIGTVAVGTDAVVTPIVAPLSLPGGAQINAWFGPFLSKVEAFRVTEAAYFTSLRDTTKKALGITPTTVSNNTGDGLAPIKLDNPMQYFTLIYSTALASLFANAVIFYIASVLLLLLILRFIVNLVV